MSAATEEGVIIGGAQQDTLSESSLKAIEPSRALQDEEAEERRLRKQREEECQRIEKPWLYETQFATSQPPDINFRGLMIDDQDTIDRLLRDEKLHFTERCLRYAEQDIWIEVKSDGILVEYVEWAKHMWEDAVKRGDHEREKFFWKLRKDVDEDCEEVRNEWMGCWDEQCVRERQQLARELGVPADQEDWTTDDQLKYRKYDIYVPGWGNPDRALDSEGNGYIPVLENAQEDTQEDAQDAFPDNTEDTDNLAAKSHANANESMRAETTQEANPERRPSESPATKFHGEQLNDSTTSNPPLTIDTDKPPPHHSPPLIQPDRGQTFFRALALLLLVLLMNEAARQRFPL